MGASCSFDYVRQLSAAEFQRILGDKERDYLHLSEVLQIKPPEEITLSFYHIGTLFVIDDDKDGRFSLVELEKFARFCLRKQKDYKQHEAHSMLQAACTLQMWLSVSKKQGDEEQEGENDFVAWVGKLLYEDENVSYFEDKPFVRSDTLLHLFELLNVKTTHGIDFQMFFDLLQQAAEEQGMMSIELQDMDDYVPLLICQQFAGHFITGFARLMHQLGF